MYICENCKEEFSEPEIKTIEEPCEYWGAQVSAYLHIETCPFCGSEDIEEVQACEICGHATSDFFRHFCDFCHKNFEYDLTQIKHDYKITQEQLEDLITEHFGW